MMRINKDKKDEIYKLLKEKGFKEDDRSNDQITVFQSELGKIKHPRIFIITTNGYVREGPLDEMESVCDGVLHGESNELRYFPYICKLDNPKEVDNPEMWQKANPSIEFMPVFYIEENNDCFALNKENNTFNLVGNSSRNIDYYINHFELQEFIDERS